MVILVVFYGLIVFRDYVLVVVWKIKCSKIGMELIKLVRLLEYLGKRR